MKIKSLLCVVGLVAGLLPGALAAQDAPAAGFNPVRFEMSYTALKTPQARLEALDAAIAGLAPQTVPELQGYFDLHDQKLGVLRAMGEDAAAAQLAMELGQFAIERADTLDRNPLPFLDLAAVLFDKAGQPGQALEARALGLRYRLDGGQSGDALVGIYADMARLAKAAGDAEAAQTYTHLAEAPPAAVNKGARASKDAGFHPVDVYYATDRARTGRSDPADFYGNGRGDLEYGIVTVTIPNTHVPGAIETPSIWRLDFGADPARHVMVRKVAPTEVNAFFARMNADMKTRSRKEAVVFVHGFNTRFDAAAKRAAQLAYDMDYHGVPILYSWPSAGQTTQYVADTAVVRLSGRRLARFLEELHARSGADTIHVVAHSMGNRAATDALEILALKAEGRGTPEPMFGQLIFAAPDVDAGLFREMTRTIRPIAQRMTVYASENDWALKVSSTLHGNAPRAGQGGAALLQDGVFDTVDMSTLGADMLAHTYFANDSSALADIMALIWQNPAPDRRCGLIRTREQTETEWRYRKGECLDKKMIAVISQLWRDNNVSDEEIRRVLARYVPDPAEAEALHRNITRLIASQ